MALDIPIGGLLLLQVFLIAVNAFFAAAEIAVVSLNETRLRRQADGGDKKAQKLLAMVMEPSGFLSTIQIAITLAGFLGSAFAADHFAGPLADWLIGLGLAALSRRTLSTVCVILITLIFSYITLIFGELLPKRVAMKEPEGVARAVCGVIGAVHTAARPLVWLLTKSVNGVMRLFGLDPKEEEEQVTEEEIRMLVDAGGESGTIEGEERDMIENIFEFNNMTAADCMIHRTDVTALQVDASHREIMNTITESGLSRFPVYGEDLDDVLGIVTTRDYLLALSSGGKKPLRQILRPARFVPESVRTDVLFRDMQRNKTHMAIVVDEYGGTSGLVTMEDLLEEIVGNIYDEYDPPLPQEIQKTGENQYRIAGSAPLEMINEALKLHLPLDEGFESLGGLLYSRLETIPKDGSHPAVECCGVRIRADEIESRRVAWATVTILNAPDKGEPKEE
ncbi:MAG: HlyC/CorC family transporter [Clostridiales bacterium]|nr:HlyC/CorC family transporter [Clostridiales bacterium]